MRRRLPPVGLGVGAAPAVATARVVVVVVLPSANKVAKLSAGEPEETAATSPAANDKETRRRIVAAGMLCKARKR